MFDSLLQFNYIHSNQADVPWYAHSQIFSRQCLLICDVLLEEDPTLAAPALLAQVVDAVRRHCSV
jgi:hypothetical protein